MSSPVKDLKEGDIIAFKADPSQTLMTVLLSHMSYNPNDLEKEEYIGRIIDICTELGTFTIISISPIQGFIYIVTYDEFIRKVDISELTEEQRKLVKD